MIGQQALRPDELGDGDLRDLAAALQAGRWLESSIDDAVVVPDLGGFADRVLAAVAGEPAPAPTGFLVPLRRRGLLAGFVASVRQAWVGLGGSGRPALGRAAALAYVLAVAIAGISLTGAATLGAAGALGLLGPSPTESPTPTVAPSIPQPTIAPAPSVAPTPPDSRPPVVAPPTSPPTPTPTPSPSESPEESDDDGGNSGPGGGGPDESDDGGGNSGPGGGGGDNSGPGSSGDSSGSGSGGSGSD